MQPYMTVDGLSAGYSGIPILQGFDLEVPPGKITTLIGTNGSGKSTALKAMSRLLSPLKGTVYLEGMSIHSMPTKLVAQKLALLPQGSQAPQGVTVRDLVEFGRFPYRTRLSGLTAKDIEVVDWALSCTDMAKLADRDMDRLSGGQRQRGWIAMALAQKTDILFLDEPTTYLDISHQLEVLQLLQQLNKEQGVTVVMVLHDLNHAIMFSDYLVAIKDGERNYAGTPSEIITPEMLRDVFDVEAEVIRHPVLGMPVCLPYGVRGQTFAACAND
ncbi:MAG: ABC transporter ATP-binding protein [Coriobacteriales bacterium]|jgi:iron complex transport system ATP-binding protein|nr:ABC transporter ATP-binding protein [Coriobacteriales bacterium]